MTNSDQFGTSRFPAGHSSSGPFNCIAFEEWLAESVEKPSPVGASSHLSAHVETCVACNEKLALARKGHEWLMMLKQERLKPPPDMVAKILAQTSLAAIAKNTNSDNFPLRDARHNFKNPSPGTVPVGIPSSSPIWQRSSVVVLRRTVLEPRLAMVAAMAFFSVSLTLNLLGVRLTGLRPADLTPRNMRRTITRQYAQTNARVVRYYENLPIVYEVEARMEQLRRAAETSAPSDQQEAKPPKQSSDLMATPAMEAAFHVPSGILARQKRSFA